MSEPTYIRLLRAQVDGGVRTRDEIPVDAERRIAHEYITATQPSLGDVMVESQNEWRVYLGIFASEDWPVMERARQYADAALTLRAACVVFTRHMLADTLAREVERRDEARAEAQELGL